MTARDVMSTPPITATPSTNIWEALAVMRDRDIRHLVVVDAEGKLAGVLSNRDYRRVVERADTEGVVRGVRNITVGEIMTAVPAVISAREDTPLFNIGQLIVLKKVGCIPVLGDDKRPIGVVGQKEVLRELLRPHLPHVQL